MLVPIDFSYTFSCRLSTITFAIRFALSHFHFLLVFHWNWASISNRFSDTGLY